jgi:hypothetical protein
VPRVWVVRSLPKKRKLADRLLTDVSTVSINTRNSPLTFFEPTLHAVVGVSAALFFILMATHYKVLPVFAFGALP